MGSLSGIEGIDEVVVLRLLAVCVALGIVGCSAEPELQERSKIGGPSTAARMDGPAMVVDAKGTAHLAWPSIIDGRTPEGDLFYASTRDAARFTPRVRIPTLGSLTPPSHPQIVIDHKR